MYAGLSIGAVIPAHNEEDNIGAVVGALLALREPQGQPLIDQVVVCDNASSDATAERAVLAGARVVEQPRPGYGIACQTAIAALPALDVVLFVDGDQAFDVRQSVDLLKVIADGADIVIGSRVQGTVEPGAMSLPQVLGNRVAAVLIRLLWGKRITDLGPFRAVRADALRRLDMRDTAYGWTVEMQVKAIQHGMNMVERPVDTRRRRFGKSKVGGTGPGASSAPVSAYCRPSCGCAAAAGGPVETRLTARGRRREESSAGRSCAEPGWLAPRDAPLPAVGSSDHRHEPDGQLVLPPDIPPRVLRDQDDPLRVGIPAYGRHEPALRCELVN